MIWNGGRFARITEWLLSCVQPMEAADAMLQTPQGLLADYRVQELLLQTVLPDLGLKMLAHLRASCPALQMLLDSQLCHSIWLQAARHLLPCQSEAHANPKQADPGLQHHDPQHQPEPSALSDMFSQQQQKQQVGLGSKASAADRLAADNQQQFQHEKQEGFMEHQGHRPAALLQKQPCNSCLVLGSVQQQLRDLGALL